MIAPATRLHHGLQRPWRNLWWMLVAILTAGTCGAGAQTPPAANRPFGVIAPEAGIPAVKAICDSYAHALWLTVDGKAECVRYWMSEAGGQSGFAMLYMTGDQVVTGPGNRPGPGDDDLTLSPAQLQITADNWSKRVKGTYVMLARPGTFGSSGRHNDRRLIREVQIVNAALSALKEKHGFLGYHLVGQSGGGHLVASMLPRRRDIGCAVIASGAVAVKARLRDMGRTIDTTGHPNPHDPIDEIERIARRPDLRVLVLTDEQDKAVSAASQSAYVDRIHAHGIDVAQIFVEAKDARRHVLSLHGLWATVDCAAGRSLEAITQRMRRINAGD